jgi:hypothetical protein
MSQEAMQPDNEEDDKQRAAIKASIMQSFADLGLSRRALDGSDQNGLWNRVMEPAVARLRAQGIEPDSLDIAEVLVQFEGDGDEGDDGGAGVREPRNPLAGGDNPSSLVAQAHATPELTAYADGSGLRYEMESSDDQARNSEPPLV